MSEEVRAVNDKTGGAKGRKPERFGNIPPEVELLLAEHYGKGEAKYGDGYNYTRGYDWSLSYDALRRHLAAFWRGEDVDEETGSLHIVAAAWHCFTLTFFSLHHRELDDRPARYREQVEREAANLCREECSDACMECVTIRPDIPELYRGDDERL